ncbi:hypothetical protein NPIL_172651, partial [Nephila pilipes]
SISEPELLLISSKWHPDFFKGDSTPEKNNFWSRSGPKTTSCLKQRRPQAQVDDQEASTAAPVC